MIVVTYPQVSLKFKYNFELWVTNENEQFSLKISLIPCQHVLSVQSTKSNIALIDYLNDEIMIFTKINDCHT